MVDMTFSGIELKPKQVRDWLGKILGGIAGLAVGGPLGAVLGLAIGHLADTALGKLWRAGELSEEERAALQRAFYLAAFGAMGHLAKADGRVSRAEIAFAEATMARMKLSAERRQEAIAQFRRGKEPDFDLIGTVAVLRRASVGNRAVRELFLHLQLQLAYADGPPSAAMRERLEVMRRALGVSRLLFRRLENLVQIQQQVTDEARGAATPRTPPPTGKLAAAYAALGVKPRDSDAAIARAYRRLLSQHHPDKLIARGASEEMLRTAAEKTQAIRRAYDQIRRARAGSK